MDPFLVEALREGKADDTVAVIVRLASSDASPPPQLRVVARFGAICTARVTRRDVVDARSHPSVASMKANFELNIDHTADGGDLSPSEIPGVAVPSVWPFDVLWSAAGVMVGVIDWGLDVAHAQFRERGGATRVACLWDQRPGAVVGAENRYGYGRIHDRAAIDRALASGDPYAALAYDPSDADSGRGSHGTHTTSIAAGSRSAVHCGVAPDARIGFVHLSTWGERVENGLGDCVALLEGIDFLDRAAGTGPLVINLSLGRHAGPHDGSTLVEQALDEFAARRGRCIVQSTGNYFQKGVHAAVEIGADAVRVGVDLRTVPGSRSSPVKVDVWYDSDCDIDVALYAPDGALTGRSAGSSDITASAQTTDLWLNGIVCGRVHHRHRDPNNQRNEALVILDHDVPRGRWNLVLTPRSGPPGVAHLWIERDPCGTCQATFEPSRRRSTTTTGTVANGHNTITVGAYDARRPGRPLAPFSSAGPTVDGRPRPDVLAPGVAVTGARSTPRGVQPGAGTLTSMTGTSMAAPHVAGLVACIMTLLPDWSGAELRKLLRRSARARHDEPARAGTGDIDAARTIRAAAHAAAAGSRNPSPRHLPNELPERTMTMPTKDCDAPLDRIAERLLERHGHDRPGLAIVCSPGQTLPELRADDLVIRRHYGFASASLDVVAEPLIAAAAGLDPRWLVNPAAPGGFVIVTTATGERAARQVTDATGRLLPGLMMLRLRDTAASPGPGSDGDGDDVPGEGRLSVAVHPLLERHGGRPQLIVAYRGITSGGSADVVVHFHGHSASRSSMRLDEKERLAGFGFESLRGASPDRRIVAILPRGRNNSGDEGRAFDFPALASSTAIAELVDDALRRVSDATGCELRRGRLILTAHSGGGAALVRVVERVDPDEVHLFDALYQDGAPVARWAATRLARERAGGSDIGALRVLHGPSTKKHTERLNEQLCRLLAEASPPAWIARRWRIESTTEAHTTVARRYGPLLLADPGADLPATTALVCKSHDGDTELDGGWGEDEALRADCGFDGNGAGDGETERWSDTPEQRDFRDRVLDAHLRRSRAKRDPQRDLRPDELDTVAGTTVQMRADAAHAAGRLLAAALTDLRAARDAGDPDATRTLGLGATSGYRGQQHQRNLWLRYFPGYFNKTVDERAALPDGPLSTAAVTYMLDVFRIPRWIAAPGYSNHQNGIAIDFSQDRTRRHHVANSSSGVAAWRSTWFHTWLERNAATYGFVPYEAEPWHWEFRGVPSPAIEADDTSDEFAESMFFDRFADDPSDAGRSEAWEEGEPVEIRDVHPTLRQQGAPLHLEVGLKVNGTAQFRPRNETNDLVLAATGAAEGRFDTVNLYDRGILSWGIMQWTAHAGSLQSLLRFIQDDLGNRASSLFTDTFGPLMVMSHGRSPFVSYDGVSYATIGELRRLFRGSDEVGQLDRGVAEHWVRRFASAGRIPEIQSLQVRYAHREIEHALDHRLATHGDPDFGTVRDYVAGTLTARALFFGMWTNNPRQSLIELRRAVDAYRTPRLLSRRSTEWPAGWESDFAVQFEQTLRASQFSTWGDEQARLANRTSRTSKILEALSKQVR